MRTEYDILYVYVPYTPRIRKGGAGTFLPTDREKIEIPEQQGATRVFLVSALFLLLSIIVAQVLVNVVKYLD